jgi:copper chaperone
MIETHHYVLNVPAISCNHCKMAIEGAVRDLQGVADVDVEVPEKTVSIRFDAGQVTLAAIKGAIEEEGYAVAGEHEFGH